MVEVRGTLAISLDPLRTRKMFSGGSATGMMSSSRDSQEICLVLPQALLSL
jgi:hypothetical protein